MTQMNQKIMHSKDRILPVQETLTGNYIHDKSEYYGRLHDLMMSFYKGDQKGIERFDLQLPEGMPYYRLGSDIPSLHLLQFLIRLCNFKTVLEIGTFVGVSAMYLAESAKDVHVTTVEIGEEFANIAKRNIETNGFADRINVVHSNAKELPQYIKNDQKFDLIYLDGDKGNYCNLFKQLLPYLSANGLFIIDDILFDGDVLNDKPSTEKGEGVVDSLREVSGRDDIEGFLLPMSNGKLLIRRAP